MKHAAATILFLCAAASAQQKLAFEVVSVKPVPRPTPETVRAGTSRIGMNLAGDRLEISGFGLQPLIARAFGAALEQVDMRGLGGDAYFEVQAKLPAGATQAQVPEMLQTMLAERFKLSYHREMRDYPVTVLTVGRSGMKLQRMPEGTPLSSKTEPLADGGIRFINVGPVRSLFAVMNSFGGIAQTIDETGLDGVYTWIREQPRPAPGVTFQASTEESFAVMLDAAGLKLEPRRLSKETIVVDSVEPMPTEN